MVVLGLIRHCSRLCGDALKIGATKKCVPSLSTAFSGTNPRGTCSVKAQSSLCHNWPATGPFTGAPRNFSTLTSHWRTNESIINRITTMPTLYAVMAQQWNVSSLLRCEQPSSPIFLQPPRHHIKFSRRQGTQKTVKAATKRFFQLRWGAWIRPRIGHDKRLWRKDWKRRQRLRRHVFCTSTQNQLLTHMMTTYWKRPKYYVDDPYEPYHARTGVFRKTPKYPLVST